MDPFVRQRRGSGGGDLNVAAGASDADYQTALSQERSEVELLRSGPVTLDDDGRRAGLEIDEAALGDKGFVDSGREPDYASAEQGVRGEAPKFQILVEAEMLLERDVERIRAKGITEETPSGSAGARGSEGSGVGSSPGSKEALFAEAAKLLQGASAKAIKVGDWSIDEAWLCSAMNASSVEYVLIDSGATNALRYAGGDELREAKSIRVDLASGVTELHVNEFGTLLSPVDCQLILPAGYLVQMGYRISWGKKGCKIRHPKFGELEVFVVKGCPLISKELGMKLLEQYERFKASVRQVKGLKCSEMSESLDLKDLEDYVPSECEPEIDHAGTLFAESGVPGDPNSHDGTNVAAGEPKVLTKTLFLGIPLRSKGGKEVMGQIQALVNRLESYGFPVHRYFSDRAKELRTQPLIQWLRERGIHAAFTAGEDPAGNKAEVVVQHLKQDARKLLRVASLPVEFWPFAVLHASQRNFVQLAETLGIGQAVLLPFGTVLHARRRLKTGHKKHWEARTVPGRYLGVATDCAGGHLVLVQEGSEQRVLLTNTVYPMDATTLPKPKYRLTTKRSPGFAVRAVAAEGHGWPSVFSSDARLLPGGECLGFFLSSEGMEVEIQGLIDEIGREEEFFSSDTNDSDSDFEIEDCVDNCQVDGTAVKILVGDLGGLGG
ncbi:TY4B-J [Symbiodinium microadriaticum]|nr:TY4B-J [Symbiodinium microadriaticum]